MTRASWAVFLMLAVLVAASNARAADATPPSANAGSTSTPPAAAPAPTAKPPVVVWPTLTPAGDGAVSSPVHRPQPAEKPLYERAQELDTTLRDAVQDLGFTLYVADPGPTPGHTRDENLIERAAGAAASASRTDAEGGTWVVSPRIESAGGGNFVVRILAVPPRGRELRVRVETVPGESVNVRGLVMLRDLLTPEAAAKAAIEQEQFEAGRGTVQGVTAPARSEGRAILAVNAGLFGAFTAFSLESAAGGQSDPRVLYPLLALGTGIGIGAALLIADEWNVTPGDAWYLSAGAGWGAAAGILIAAGHDVQPLTNRYSWGVGGGLAGATLATVALTQRSMDEGDATLTHSGGALGLLAGGAIDWIGRGTTAVTPYKGMGYGTAIGLASAGLLATQVTVSPSRVLLIDVGAGGGALIGAAVASPLIFQNPHVFQNPDQGSAGNTRGWLAATVGGGVVGGGLAWWLTRNTSRRLSWLPLGEPTAGIIGSTEGRGPKGGISQSPIYGIGWSGGL